MITKKELETLAVKVAKDSSMSHRKLLTNNERRVLRAGLAAGFEAGWLAAVEFNLAGGLDAGDQAAEIES